MNQRMRLSSALAPPWLLVAVAALLLGAVLWSLPAQAAPRAAIEPPSYCYNWDFLNDTGQDADDLHIDLRGVKQVSDVYTGPANPFGPLAAGSGYDAGQDIYRLNFAGGPVAAGDMAHIGICTDSPTLRLATGVSFVWTVGNQPLDPAPLFAAVGWEWLGPTHLRVTLFNDQDRPLVLWSLNLLAVDQPLGLDDLNADVFATAPMVSELAPDVVTVAAGTKQSFDVALSQTSGNPLLIEAVVSTEDDSGDTAHLYGQVERSPMSLYLPIIARG